MTMQSQNYTQHSMVWMVLLFILTFFFAFAQPTYAVSKSVTWTYDRVPWLTYFYNSDPRAIIGDTVPLDTTPGCDGSCGWVGGLGDASVQVTYKARLINLDTGTQINDRSTVPVGTRFRVERDSSTINRDISWIGTGSSSDSPYGRWVNNAGPLSLACRAEDRVADDIYFGRGPIGDVFVLLNVNPVSPAVINPSANLSCTGNVCRVTGPGTVSVGLNFPDTYGKFYYRYSFSGPRPEDPDDLQPGCHGNNAPMAAGGTIWGCHEETCVNRKDPYVLNIPDRTITFTLTAATPNNPPTPPVVTPNPANSTPNTSVPFTLTTSDPDRDDVRFHIDWNNDGFTDQRQPSLGYSNVTTQSVAHTWTSPGTFTFKVRAEDENGALSTWTTAVANIALGIPTGLTATPNTVCNSGRIDVTWNPVSGAQSYTLRDGGAVIYTGAAASFSHTGLVAGSSHNYSVRANHTSGNSAYSAIVNGVAPAACGSPTLTTLTAPGCAIVIGGSTCNTTVTWGIGNPNTPSIAQNGVPFSTVSSGNASRAITFGTPPENTFTVSDVNGVLGTITPEGVCASGGIWNGSLCAQPDLTILEDVQLNTGTLTQGNDITVRARIKNVGIVGTQVNFADRFEYQWNGGVWNTIGTVSRAPLDANTEATDISPTLTLNNSGTLIIRHCVDVLNVVTETNENDNCRDTNMGNVTTITPGGPTVSLTAQDCEIPQGASSCDIKLTWTSNPPLTDPSVDQVGGPNIATDPQGTDVPVNRPRGTYTFTLTERGGDPDQEVGRAVASARCAPTLSWDGDSCEKVPSGDISADPTEVPSGGSSFIEWTTTGATNCTVTSDKNTDSWTGTSDTGKQTSPLTAPTTYTLRCDGYTLDSVTVNVPGPDIDANPRLVPAGEKSTVTWDPHGVQGCVVNGGSLVNIPANTPGSQEVQINGLTTFTISCGGVDRDRVRVDILPKGHET